MNKPKIHAPRRLKRSGDYHVIQIRFEPLLWALVQHTASQRGETVARLVHNAVMVGLSSNSERDKTHER